MSSDNSKNGKEIKNVWQDVGWMREIGFLAHDLVDDVPKEGLILVKS